MVLAAGASAGASAHEALERLCRSYWPSIYHYARRLGHTDAGAKDLTQAFFEHFLEKGYIRAADPQRGRFRGFLRTSFKHFTEREWAKTRAQKRGGGRDIVSFEDWRDIGQLESVSAERPDLAYDRVWALRLFSQAVERLQNEFTASGKSLQYETLKPFLDTPGDQAAYAQAARRIDSTPNAVAVAVHRLKQRLRELVMEEVANTVASPADVDDEFRHLRNLLSS